MFGESDVSLLATLTDVKRVQQRENVSQKVRDERMRRGR